MTGLIFSGEGASNYELTIGLIILGALIVALAILSSLKR